VGRGLGGFEAYSSELPPMQNCELLPSHFDEFASEGRAEPHASETGHTSVSHRKEFSMPKHAYLII